MKSFFLVLALLVVVQSLPLALKRKIVEHGGYPCMQETEADEKLVHESLPLALKRKIVEHGGYPCMQETEADEKLVHEVMHGNYSINDWKIKLLNLCVLKRIGFVDAGNNFHREIALQHLNNDIKDRAAIDKCVNSGNVVSPDLAWTYVGCYNTERPIELLK